MGRLLATLATFLILLLGAAFVVPAFMDWNSYRQDVEGMASSILGRKIAIQGDIEIALLPEPHLHATAISARNAAGGADLMTAEAVDLSLSLQALMGGRFEANKLKLLRPTLTLDFAKPLAAQLSPTEASVFAMDAVNSVEIEGGRILFLAKNYGYSDGLGLTNIGGTLSAQSPGNSYRFSGRFSQKDRHFDVKALGSLTAANGVRITGSGLEVASRAAFQADGIVTVADGPVFDGAFSMTTPQGSGLPVELQLKASTRIDLAGAALSDLVITVDPQNRAQIAGGSAEIAFVKETANITLQAHSFDADALVAPSGGPATPWMAETESSGWTGTRSAAGNLLWLYPNFAVRLSLAADRMQLKGESVEGVKIDGMRTAQRWVFERMLATLPGETAVRLAGTLNNKGGAPQISATAALDGKNLGRLGRWLAPASEEAKALASSPFAIQGSLSFSDQMTALEGVTGNIDGTPFTAGLHIDHLPSRRLQLSLTTTNLDLSGVNASSSGGEALSFESLKTASQTNLERIAALFGSDARGFSNADIDVSAGSVKTSLIEAKNVALHAKFNEDLITVSRLGAETPDGLSLRGEGIIPLKGAGQGRFDGRLEARSPQAVLQLAALTGYDGANMDTRRAADLAPAALSISYGADTQAGTSTAQLSGTLGSARLDGRAQLKGMLADWKTGPLSAQLNVSAIDGNKLLAQLFTMAVFSPGASLAPGSISARITGSSQKLETSVVVKTGALQAQLDGVTENKAQGYVFSGKGSAASQTPEQFMPPALLALLGGEPKANLRLDANLVLFPGHYDADKLRAESPKNVVSGHLGVDTKSSLMRIDADLKADQMSLPSLFSYFIAPAVIDPANPLASSAAILTQSATQNIWSDRPFSLAAFQDVAGRITLSAKTLKLSDAIAVSDGLVAAKLEKGRLDIQRLEGKAFGGDLAASLTLEAKAGAAAAGMRISLSNADLSALASSGNPALVAGKGSLSLQVFGQGLSPRGLVSVLAGRGFISLSDGQLPKLSPAAMQKSAEDMLALPQPLTEDTISKKVLEASQSGDFKFRRLKIPVTIRDGTLEIRRASFRNRDGTVRMEAYLDLAKMQADSTWQVGVSSDRRAKWPPVKIQVSGPFLELGGRPRTLVAEDFVRAVLVRKMEGDITKLEGLNKPQAPASSWTTKQEPVQKPTRRKKRDDDVPSSPSLSPGGATAVTPDFESRMRDALQSRGTATPAAR